nr:hypothetical protein [uncultured Sphingomonas sp.]
MTERSTTPQTATRSRLLAELDTAVSRARARARALTADPQCKLEVGLLVVQLDRIAAEVEQIRLEQPVIRPASTRPRPRHWHKLPDERPDERKAD